MLTDAELALGGGGRHRQDRERERREEGEAYILGSFCSREGRAQSRGRRARGGSGHRPMA